jgi:serine/threonine protein kinase
VTHPLLGQRLGHFDLIAPLGSGAMSEVYVGLDRQLDKKVAVKVINDNLARQAELVERFGREAKAAARLEHPNVATVYFFGTHEGKPFFAMELIRGWSLGDVIEGRIRFTWDQALALFAQACVGLGAAQEAGVIHRDIKPGNLMATQDGTLKIVDFGLAKLGEDKSLTRSGAMMGTPYYIAPELIQGLGGSLRSDLYSLGVTFFHVLAGHPPYDAETPYGVMMQHIGDPVPQLRSLNGRFPQEVSDLVEALMAKDPLDRPATYRDVHRHLRKLAAGLPRELLTSELAWCAIDKVNTEPEGGRCSLCRRPYGVRELPEVFHVDLVAWNRNHARDAVSTYISKAVGQSEEEIATLLDPLPFRAAFRVPRTRAKRMQRDFYELGADVSLVPAVEEGEAGAAIRVLPFKARWPRPSQAAGTGETSPVPSPRRSRSGQPLHPATVVATFLGLVVAVLAVLLAREWRAPAAPEEPPPRVVAALTSTPPTAAEAPAELSPTPAPTVVPEATATAVQDGEQPSPEVVDPEETTPAPTRPASLESSWFDLDAGGVPVPQAQEILDALEEAAAHVQEQLGLVADQRIPVRLSPRPLVRTGRDRAWTEATYAPVIEFPSEGAAGGEALRPAARNLVARAVIRRAAGPSVPPWLLVGLSSYLEAGPVPRDQWTAVVGAGRLPTETEVAVASNSAETELLLRAFATFLVQRRGWPGPRSLLLELGSGATLDEAMKQSLEATPAELEQVWVAVAGGVD